MTLRWWVPFLVAAYSVVGQPAYAQADPGSGLGGLRRITGACRAETARFCPALANAAPSPRNQLICLRPYKSSLSLSCRSAVNAMTRN